MDALARLVAIEDIKQLKARYFRFLDTQQWPELERVFTDDAVLDMSAEGGTDQTTYVGPHDIVAFIAAVLDGVVTVHHGHTCEITVESADRASGVWAMEDRLQWPASGTAPARWMHGFGHYNERYQRVEGEWRISSMRLTRLRRDESA